MTEKNSFFKAKKLLNDKKGVFGLTSVQQFFAIILGVALLAYVIVVIMGTLSGSTILPTSTQSTTVVNESTFINQTGDQLGTINTVPGLSNIVVILAINATSGAVIPAANYTVSATGVITNATANTYNFVNITYSYSFNSATVNNANSILGNTSNGVAGFFSNINPVYAILAILVIILVLVVLVRVVTNGAGGTSLGSPQL